MNKGLGIGATLIGGLIGILLSYLWFGISQGIDDLTIGYWYGGHVYDNKLYRSWYLFFIAILMMRHFFRILFLERQVDYPIKNPHRIFAFWLLLAVTLIGFFIKTLLPLSASVFNSFLYFYSLIFALFGLFIVFGFDEDEVTIDYLNEVKANDVSDLSTKQDEKLKKTIKDKKTAIWTSIFVDIIAVGICIYTPVATQESLVTLLMAGVLIFGIEINTLYGKQIKDQFISIKQYLAS